MASTDFSRIAIVRLSTEDNNYVTWLPRAAARLKSKGVHAYVLGKVPVVTEPTALAAGASSSASATFDTEMARHVEWQTKDDLAMSIIYEMIDNTQDTHIGDAKTSQTAWERLEKAHVGASSGVAAFFIKLGMIERKYVPGESMTTHINALLQDNARLRQSKQSFDDEFIAQLMLFSLPRNIGQWETLTVTLLQGSSVTNPLTPSDVQSRLVAETMRIDGAASSERALAARTNTRTRPAKSTLPARSNDWCDFCKFGGHKTADCRRKAKADREKSEAKKGGKGGKPPKRESAAVASSSSSRVPDSDDESSSDDEPVHAKITKVSGGDQSREHVFIAVNLTKESRDEVNVDSGSSRHLSPNLSWFEPSSVRLLKDPIAISTADADASTILATATGTLLFDIAAPKGQVVRGRFERTLYVPGLATTLISVSQLTRGPHRLVFDDNRCDIVSKANGEIIGSAKRTRDNLYRVTGTPVIAKSPAVLETAHAAIVDINLLHDRLGHLGYQNIQCMVRDGIVSDVDGLKGVPRFCEPCIHGKQHRLPFPSKTFRSATEKLDLVHSDLCGPFPGSIGGKRYFVTFIDDYTRKYWLYFLRKKSDVFESFKEWKELVETESGFKVKSMCVDGGGEYFSKEQIAFRKLHGISVQITAPDNPETNGLAERANRTVVDGVRSMLFGANLSTGFWAEAAATAAYLNGFTPSAGLKKMSPDEAWYGRKRSISRLRTFGCAAYAFVDKLKRTKLQSKTRKCVLMGYEPNTRNYRLWDPAKHTIIRARNVLFDESMPAADAPREFDLSDFTWPGGDNTQMGQAENISYLPDDYDEPAVAPLATQPDELEAPVAPAPAPAPQRRHRRTELEMLGPAEDLGPRVPKPSQRARDIHATVEDHVDAPEAAAPADANANADSANLAYSYYTTAGDGTAEGDIAFAFASTLAPDEPRTYREAMAGSYAKEWREAITREMDALKSNKTFGKSRRLPAGCKAIGSRFVFKIKRNADGTIEKFKARLVAKGFSQVPGVDFGETFAPVVKWNTLRVVLALAAQLNLDIHQLDYETAFLNGAVEEGMFLRLPEGAGATGEFNDVEPLLRALYGLKQSGRVWNKALDEDLTSAGWTRCSADSCLYIMRRGNTLLLLAVYVDDLLLLGNDPATIRRQKKLLGRRFKIKDLGEAKLLLGVEIIRDREQRTIELSQRRYILELGERFGQTNAKPASTPLSSSVILTTKDSPVTAAERADMANVPYQALIGALMYAMLCTRPDIAFAVGALSKFSSNPGRIHWREAIHTLRYLLTTADHTLMFDGNHSDPILTPQYNQLVHGYTDSDWAGDIDKRKSTGGYVFLMAGAAVSWSSKRQPTVALSSTEAEYMSTTRSAQEAIWLSKLLDELGQLPKEPKPILVRGDNQGAITLAKNPGDHPRTKHIAIKYHFTREVIEAGTMALSYCPTDEMTADVLTKGLGCIKHELFTHKLGITPPRLD